MVKTCPQHGEFLSLIYRNKEAYLASLQISKPAERPRKYFIEEYSGCPESCGLCPEHKQHTCLPIIEITDHCTMSCPICLADNRNNYYMSPSTFARIIDNLIEAEGTLEIINISGGEPTLHPNLLEILDIANRSEIITLTISTNGKRFLEDENLLLELKKRNAFIAFQFDGFDETAYKVLRGQNVLEEKLKILQLLEKHDIATSLTMTVMNGVNNAEIGKVTNYFLQKDFIKSLMFQPVNFSNPNLEYSIDKVITIPDIAQEIAQGTANKIKESEIINVPCSHTSCFAATYLLKIDEGEFIPIPRLVAINDYLDIIKNRSMPGFQSSSYEKIKECIYDFWSVSGLQPESKKILKAIKGILCELENTGTIAEPKNLFKIAEKQLKSIFIHNFMDGYNFDFDRVVKCCHHYPKGQKKLIPCCIYNNLMRWK